MLMRGYARCASVRSVKTPVRPSAVTSAGSAGIDAPWLAVALTRPSRKLFTRLLRDDPGVRQLPVRRVLLERRVAEIADAAAGDVAEGGLREPSEHRSVVAEIVIDANRVLVLILRQRPDQLIVALRRTDCSAPARTSATASLRQPRIARLRNGVVRKRLTRRRVDDRAREVAGQLVGCRDVVERAEPALDADALVVDEEERLVLEDRTADDEPRLLLIELGLGRILRVEEVPRVQFLVADEVERRPVELRSCPTC